jgi:hypothetical protein
MQLRQHLKTLPVAGTYALEVRGTEHQPPRTAQMEVRWGTIALPIPRDCG